MTQPRRANIHWDPAYRIIATRFPAVDIWAPMDANLWDRLDLIEASTNPRLAAGHPTDGYVHWPFDNPRPGRFSTRTMGAFYAAQEEATAVAETVHHQAIRCHEDQLDPHDFDMRVLSVEVLGAFHDLRGRRAEAFPGVMDPHSHAASQALTVALYASGSKGVVFESVRSPIRSACVAAWDPATILRASHLRYLTYRWDGKTVAPMYEKRPFVWTRSNP